VTKIYIYCLFDRGAFVGVYSSLKAVHRDALRLANKGHSPVVLLAEDQKTTPSLTALRNIFRGKCDYEVSYRTPHTAVKVYKTKLKE